MRLFPKKAQSQTLTGVAATLAADHRSREGHVHGHTWDITVWFVAHPTLDAVAARHTLERALEPHQGKCLPDRIAWGEPMAAWIATEIASDYRAPVQVDVSRVRERLYAKWRAL